MSEKRRQLVLRVGFLALLAGGLLLWSRARMPKEVQVVVDLTYALPGEVSEVDVVVTRGGHALARSDRRFAVGQAPQKIVVDVRAAPGAADVEATVLAPGRPARRATGRVELAESAPGLLTVR